MEATEIDCSVNLTGEILVQRLEMLGDVIQEFYGWLQLPLAIPTLLLLIKHVVTLAQQLRTNKVSKRSSIMLLNRGIGDMVTCISVILIAFYVLLKEPSQSDNIASLLDMFCMCSFWSAMLSNISISLLKLYAFWRPLGYSQTVTVRRCLHLIAVSWILFLLILFYQIAAYSLIEMYPSVHRWYGCRILRCTNLLIYVRPIAEVVTYALTIVIFLITVAILHRAEQVRSALEIEQKTMKARQHRYPIWKLSLDVATFGIFYLFHVVFIIFSLLQDDCFFLANLMEMRQAFGIIRCGLLLRILADQLIIVAINWFFSNHSQPLPNTISLFGIPSSGKNDKIGRLIRENCETKPKEEATLLAVGP